MPELSELEVSLAGLQRKEKTSWKDRWKQLWLYVILQCGWGALIVFATHKIKWFWWLPIQWIGVWLLWYWQMQSFKLEGLVLWTEPGNVKRWDVIHIRAMGAIGFMLVYRVEKFYGGRIAVSMLPINYSRKKWRNRFRKLYYKGLVLLRLVK